MASDEPNEDEEKVSQDAETEEELNEPNHEVLLELPKASDDLQRNGNKVIKAPPTRDEYIWMWKVCNR